MPVAKDGRQSVGEGGVGVLLRTGSEELLLDGGGGLSALAKLLVNVRDGGMQILGAVSCAVSLHAPGNGLEVHAHVDLGLGGGGRRESSVDGLRVLIAHEGSAHGRIRATDHDPRRLGGSEVVLDVLAGEFLGKNDNVLEGLLGGKPLEDLWLGVDGNGDVSRGGVSV